MAYTSQSQSTMKKVKAGIHGRDLDIETEAEVMEEYCLLAYSSWLAQCVFLATYD